MEKENIKRCIDLTQEIMVRHFQGDDDLVINLLHKNCIWIGSCASEFYQGKEAIVKVLNYETKNLPPVELSAMEYMCASHDIHDCIVTGRHMGQTTLESGEIYRDMQRVTFVWKKQGEELFIMHIHVSNPMNNVQNGEIFPHKVGIYTKEYFNMLVINDVRKTGTITIKDQRNRFHIVKIKDIVYCEAFNMNCIIHLKKNDIFGRVTLLELEKMLKNKNIGMFKRVHKSYLVNKYLVESLERYEIVVQGGGTIPVSKERYCEIREWLHGK